MGTVERSLRQFSSDEWSAAERVLQAFEEAWQQGHRPAPEDYLPAGEAAPPALLAELAHLDLEYRLKAGEPARVEAYLERFPQLGQDRRLTLGLIRAEYALRRRGEPGLGAEEYARRFPPYRDELRAALAMLDSPTLLPEASAELATHLSGPGPSADPTEECYPFLAPPQGPGEIGRLGGYRILRVLGKGGMGVVFLAEDPDLQRPVALKVMRAPLDEAAAGRQRFLREARLAASLKHDHIVTVYQVGHDRGVPFLAMELLEGESLADRLKREGRLPLAEVLRIGREAAEALAAAHARRLVHRDIKPANLFLEGPRGRVKILDFGLARGGDDPNLTQSGALLGTPAYMSPEQAACEATDHRSDLFSLGAVLYQICTGAQPFPGRTAHAVVEAVLHEEPRPVTALNPTVPAGLCELIRRLLVKDPAQRLQSADEAALALATLQAWGAGRTEEAPPARVPRRRRPLAVATGVLLLVGLIVGVATLTRVRSPRGKAPAEPPPGAPVAEAPPSPLDDLQRDRIDPYELAMAGGGDRAKAPPGLVAILGDSRFKCWSKITAAAIAPGRGFAACGAEDGLVKVFALDTGEERFSLEAHSGRPVRCVAFRPDGKVLASADDESVKLWDLDGGRLLSRLVQPAESRVAFSGDGKRLAAGDKDGAVRVWDVATEKELCRFNHGGAVNGVALSPDGGTVASAGMDGKVKVWATDTRQPLPAPEGCPAPVSSVTFSPDGKYLACADWQGVVRLWDLAAGRERSRLKAGLDGQTRYVNALTFSADGRRLAGVWHTDVYVWATDGGSAPEVLGPHDGLVHAVAFGEGGRVLTGASSAESFSSGPGQMLQLRSWDGNVPTDLSPTRGHRAEVCAIAVSPDGKWLASGSRDRTALVWDLATGKVRFDLGKGLGSNALAFSPDSTLLAVESGPHVQLIDLKTGKPRHQLQVKPGAGWVAALAFSRDGATLATSWRSADAGAPGELAVWDVASGAPLRPPTPTAYAGNSWVQAFSPDGDQLFWAGSNKAVMRWKVASGKALPPLTGHADAAYMLAFRKDPPVVATSGDDGTVRLWDLKTGKAITTLSCQRGGLAFRPGSPILALLGWVPDGFGVRLWDTAADAERAVYRLGPWWTVRIQRMVFAPDGRHLLTANGNGTIYVFRLGNPPRT